MLQIIPKASTTGNPMLSISKSYRIARTDQAGWYWTGSIWGDKADAKLYTERERNEELLPERGCWELLDAPVDVSDAAVSVPYGRSLAAQMIAQILLSQYCREERVQLRRLNELAPKEQQRFVEAGEFITNAVLSPDRLETALLAMADVFCMDGDVDALSIFHASPRTQKRYYSLAVSALHALQENVKEVPPDWNYRDRLCRLLDAIVPKSEQEPNAHVHPTFRGILNNFAKGGR